MRRTFFLFTAGLITGFLAAPAGADETVTYFHGRDARADIAAFVGLEDGKSLGLEGDGGCGVTVTRVGETLRISPEFSVGAKRDLSGGFTATRLWASYFVDDPGAHVIHGQFGAFYSIEIERGASGELRRYAFRLTQRRDLSVKTLRRFECLNLHVVRP